MVCKSFLQEYNYNLSIIQDPPRRPRKAARRNGDNVHAGNDNDRQVCSLFWLQAPLRIIDHRVLICLFIYRSLLCSQESESDESESEGESEEEEEEEEDWMV